MRKVMAVLAVSGLAAGAAVAQSSVTIYGTLDLSIRNVKNNSGNMWSQQAAGNHTSNAFGFRGTEDLGGGWSANFNIESDIFPDTGQAGNSNVSPQVPANQFWSRMAWVGLKGNEAGEVRFGRDYTPGHRTIAGYDPFGYIGVGAISNILSSGQGAAAVSAFSNATGSANTIPRVNNSAAYYTPPTLGGFFAVAQVALGEGAVSTGPTGASKYYGGRVGYAKGPVSVAAVYMLTKNTNLPGQEFKEWVIGGAYDFGVLRLSSQYVDMRYVNSKMAVAQVGIRAPVGDRGSLKASYTQIDQSGTAATAIGATPVGGSVADRDARMFAVGYAYDLSKRTALYTQAAQVRNKGRNAAFSIIGGPAFVAGSDRKSTAVEFGVRHNF